MEPLFTPVQNRAKWGTTTEIVEEVGPALPSRAEIDWRRSNSVATQKAWLATSSKVQVHPQSRC